MEELDCAKVKTGRLANIRRSANTLRDMRPLRHKTLVEYSATLDQYGLPAKKKPPIPDVAALSAFVF